MQDVGAGNTNILMFNDAIRNDFIGFRSKQEPHTVNGNLDTVIINVRFRIGNDDLLDDGRGEEWVGLSE